jgi:hypothetical protein
MSNKKVGAINLLLAGTVGGILPFAMTSVAANLMEASTLVTYILCTGVFILNLVISMNSNSWGKAWSTGFYLSSTMAFLAPIASFIGVLVSLQVINATVIMGALVVNIITAILFTSVSLALYVVGSALSKH